MSDEQHKKPGDPPSSVGVSGAADRGPQGPATLGGLADLIKASKASSSADAGAPISLGGLADLVKAEPKSEAPPPPTTTSPFDQKVGSAASQYTFVMNSSDLKDLIGDPNKQRVSVHSASSAGFDSAPKPAHSEPPPKPATADLPVAAPSPTSRDLPPPRAPSRTGSRAPVVKTRPERSNTTGILLAVAVLLLLVFLLMRRNAALEDTRRAPTPSPAATSVEDQPPSAEE